MRYSITQSSSSSKSGNTTTITTTTNKTLYFTIGDVIGACKSASSAVTKLKAFVAAGTSGGTSTKALMAKYGMQAIGSMVNPLIALITAADVYQKIVKVTETATVAAKTVARVSGMFMSPGNAGDIAAMVLGLVNKVLIQLAMAAVTALKEYIWNYEISIPLASETASRIITRSISSAATSNSTTIASATSSLTTSSSTVSASTYFATISADVSDESEDEDEVTETSYLFGAIISVEKDGGTRLIAGGDWNNGLWYSDDNGENWTRGVYSSSGEETTFSWKCLVATNPDITNANNSNYDSSYIFGNTYIYAGGYCSENAPDYNSDGVYISKDYGETWEYCGDESERLKGIDINNLIETSSLANSGIENKDQLSTVAILTKEGNYYIEIDNKDLDTLTTIKDSSETEGDWSDSGKIVKCETLSAENLYYLLEQKNSKTANFTNNKLKYKEKEEISFDMNFDDESGIITIFKSIEESDNKYWAIKIQEEDGTDGWYQYKGGE